MKFALTRKPVPGMEADLRERAADLGQRIEQWARQAPELHAEWQALHQKATAVGLDGHAREALGIGPMVATLGRMAAAVVRLDNTRAAKAAPKRVPMMLPPPMTPALHARLKEKDPSWNWASPDSRRLPFSHER